MNSCETHAENLIHNPAGKSYSAAGFWAACSIGPLKRRRPMKAEKRELQARLTEILRRLAPMPGNSGRFRTTRKQSLRESSPKGTIPSAESTHFFRRTCIEPLGPWVELRRPREPYASGRAT